MACVRGAAAHVVGSLCCQHILNTPTLTCKEGREKARAGRGGERESSFRCTPLVHYESKGWSSGMSEQCRTHQVILCASCMLVWWSICCSAPVLTIIFRMVCITLIDDNAR